MGTPEGRARLEAYEEKVDQAIADRIEDADKAQVDDTQPRPTPEAPRAHHGRREDAGPDPVSVPRPVVRDEEPATAADDQLNPDEGSNFDDHDADGDAEMDMVPEPNLDKHVFCRVREDRRDVMFDPNDPDNTMDLDQGDIIMVRYRFIKGLLEDGALDLI